MVRLLADHRHTRGRARPGRGRTRRIRFWVAPDLGRVVLRDEQDAHSAAVSAARTASRIANVARVTAAMSATGHGCAPVRHASTNACELRGVALVARARRRPSRAPPRCSVQRAEVVEHAGAAPRRAPRRAPSAATGRRTRCRRSCATEPSAKRSVRRDVVLARLGAAARPRRRAHVDGRAPARNGARSTKWQTSPTIRPPPISRVVRPVRRAAGGRR